MLHTHVNLIKAKRKYHPWGCALFLVVAQLQPTDHRLEL